MIGSVGGSLSVLPVFEYTEKLVVKAHFHASVESLGLILVVSNARELQPAASLRLES